MRGFARSLEYRRSRSWSGLAGSLHWNDRVGYAYGAELVLAVRMVRRPDVVAVIVGDGSGRTRLEEMAGDDLGTRVLLPGRVPAEEVPDYLASFDVGSLSQSVDGVGSFRYTTKMSEYLASGLPVIAGEVPAAYDLDEGYMWRLPGPAPWSELYIRALAELLESLSPEEVARRRDAIARRRADPFDKATQQQRMSEFVRDILAERGASGLSSPAHRRAASHRRSYSASCFLTVSSQVKRRAERRAASPSRSLSAGSRASAARRSAISRSSLVIR